MKKDKYVWNSWFAWHPVIASGRVVWLRGVERRRLSLDFVSKEEWFYKLPAAVSESKIRHAELKSLF